MGWGYFEDWDYSDRRDPLNEEAWDALEAISPHLGYELDGQLGELLQHLRAIHGVTQRELAMRAGVHRSVIVRLERGLRAPSWRRFTGLLAHLGYVPQVGALPLDDIRAVAHDRAVRYSAQLSANFGIRSDEMGRPMSGDSYGFLHLGPDRDSVSTIRADGSAAGDDAVAARFGAVSAPVEGPGFETLAIHAGQEPDASTGAVVPPIHQVSTYAQDGVGSLRGGYEYSRSGNPTRTALESCLVAIEGADPEQGGRGFAFASGLAAEDVVVRAVCRPGDHVVIPGDAYGGTYRLFARVLADWGVRWTAVRQDDPAAVAAAMQDNTRLVWCETPTNPLLTVADIAALGEIAHGRRALLAVDNTFASPYLQQPLAHGADVVMHSTTKYLGGHSDVVGGALVCRDPDLAERIGFLHNATGAVAGPFDSWLVLRGIRTLAVRMERHCDNAEAVAALLREHPAVTEVLYPDADPVARRQMKRFGGMVSFRVDGGEQQAVDVCGRARVFTLAESLGGVESLIEHPGRMTHASAAGSELQVPDDLIRLSVGLESQADLLADLEQALG